MAACNCLSKSLFESVKPCLVLPKLLGPLDVIVSRPTFLIFILASAGISSSSSLLSALKMAETGLGRETEGRVTGCGRAVLREIFMPKPFPEGLDSGICLAGERGGLGEGDVLETGMDNVFAGGGGCRGDGAGISPRGGGTPGGATPSGGGGARPRGGGAALSGGGGRLGIVPDGGGGGTKPRLLSSSPSYLFLLFLSLLLLLSLLCAPLFLLPDLLSLCLSLSLLLSRPFLSLFLLLSLWSVLPLSPLLSLFLSLSLTLSLSPHLSLRC